MKIIGIVGATGAGKTTALNVLREFNAEILDCDAIYHQLLTTSNELRERLIARFGSVFDSNGLNRKKLGSIVFGNQQALADLNAITFDIITAEIRRRTALARERGCAVTAIDGVALLDSDLKQDCDAMVAITAPVETRIRRIMARENISEEYARKRVSAQKPDSWFSDHCDYTLVNDGDQETYARRARTLFEHILSSRED